MKRRYQLVIILLICVGTCLGQPAYLIELACPAGSSPLPYGTTFNSTTGKYRQVICVDASGNISIAGITGDLNGVPVTAVTPQTGDTLVYNRYGDAAWDVSTGEEHKYWVVAPAGGSTSFLLGGHTNTAPGVTGSATGVAVSATEPAMIRLTGSSLASLNVTVGMSFLGGQPGAGHLSWGTLQRYTLRLRLETTTNTRFWIGVSNQTNSVGGNADFATDTPNFSYAAFRFSSGTDAAIKAVTGTDNTHQTVVNTGVAVDTTNSVLFEITPGPTTEFFLNGVLVATINTNIPTAATTMRAFWCGDNKNNAVAAVASHAFIFVTGK